MTEMILTYVPESEHLDYNEAQALALERDRRAADAFKASVPIEEILVDRGYFVTRSAWKIR